MLGYTVASIHVQIGYVIHSFLNIYSPRIKDLIKSSLWRTADGLQVFLFQVRQITNFLIKPLYGAFRIVMLYPPTGLEF